MSVLLALFIGIGLAKILLLPAILGILIGLYIYSKSQPAIKFNWTYYQGGQQNHASYHHHLFSLMGYLAKADGLVSENEINITEHIISELGLNYSQKKLAKASFKSGTKGLNLVHTTAYLQTLKLTSPHLLASFFSYQQRIIHADPLGKMHQINILNQIKFNLRQEQQQGSYNPLPQNQLSNAYKILGIHAKMTYPEMKKSYQKLIGKHHPDRAKNELEKTKSEAYVKTVQKAWESVKKHHKEKV